MPEIKIYTDQDGVRWDASYARCLTGCGTPTDFSDRVPGSGYFRCSGCGHLYDEPIFDEPEFAFLGGPDDDDIDRN